MPDGSKAEVRASLIAARRAVPDSVRAEEARRLAGHLEQAVAGAPAVCAYFPVGTEPGDPALLDQLADICAEVLLPVARTGPGGEHLPLMWGRYVPRAPGLLTKARFGLHEPAGPWFPAGEIARVPVILVPALAVDRAGVRLGRGGGFYDRSLALCMPGSRLVAVVRDSEIVGELPREPHDILMTHALAPAAGLVALGGGAARGE